MVPLAQGLVPMLPVTSLLPVRTARGNVVYMAPMQPILGGTSDDPGFIAVDDQVTTRINSRINSRWHATETTTTRTMTTETTRSGSETGRMTREEWELERKEKKKEKKEKKKKEKRRRGRRGEEGETKEEERGRGGAGGEAGDRQKHETDEAGMAGLDAARRLSSPGRLLRRQPSVRGGGRVLGSRFLRRVTTRKTSRLHIANVDDD